MRHVQNRSVQADSVGVCRPICCTVSVTDAAVEVGESLWASGSQWQNSEVTNTSSAVTVPSVIVVSVQSNPECTTSTTGAAPVRQSWLREPLPDRTFSFQNRPCHQQTEHTASVEHLPTDDSDHIAESSPVIVIVPDESVSPAYRLSCDERSSCEKSPEVSEPLDILVQSGASLCANQVVRNTVPC